MRTRKAFVIACLLTLALGLSRTARAQATGSTANPAGEVQGIRAATVLTMHGKISAVDKSQSLVTLDINGRSVALKVENPVNLEAAKVGDSVVIRYYEVVSIRKKKPGEEVPSISVKDGITTAKPGGPAGAVASQEAKVLVTVNAVDPADGTIALQGPDGVVETVKARDPKLLRHVKAGDQLVVKVTRATAISLDKDPAN